MKLKVRPCKYYGKKDLICPHCGKQQRTHEPDAISAYLCVTTCEHCERDFEYCVEVSRVYYPTIPDGEEEKEESEE